MTYGDAAGTAAEALWQCGHDAAAIEEDPTVRTIAPWLVASMGDSAPDDVKRALQFDHPDRILLDLPRGFDSPRWAVRRDAILAVLADYNVEAWLLNSANYGAGFSMRRLMVVGVHKALNASPVKPRWIRPQTTVADVLGVACLPAWASWRAGPALPVDEGAEWGPRGEPRFRLSQDQRSALLGLPTGHYAGPATPVALYRAVLEANKGV